METLLFLDLDFVIWVKNTLQHETWNPFWIFMTMLGNVGAVWIVSSLILLVSPKTRKVGMLCAGALVFSVIICNLGLKPIVMRARPFNYFDANLLVKAPHDYSFPSGHTSASFAMIFVLMKEKFKIKGVPVYLFALLLAIFISFSRIYLSLHFLTDILGGIAIGTLCGYLSYVAVGKWQSNTL